MGIRTSNYLLKLKEEYFNMAKYWYKSKTVWGGLIAVGAAIAGAFGVSMDADTQNKIADYIVVGVGAVGGLVAIYGRFKADQQIK